MFSEVVFDSSVVFVALFPPVKPSPAGRPAASPPAEPRCGAGSGPYAGQGPETLPKGKGTFC